MNTRQRQPRTDDPRRGFLTLELLYVVPVLVVVLAVTLQYGKAMVIRSSLVQAATVAAREAGKGAGIADVVQAVNLVLAIHGIAVSDRPGSGTKLVVQLGQAMVQEYGDAEISLPRTALRDDETLVAVWINFDARRSDGRKLLGDSCGALNLAFAGRGLGATALVRQERDLQAAAASRQSLPVRHGNRGVSTTH